MHWSQGPIPVSRAPFSIPPILESIFYRSKLLTRCVPRPTSRGISRFIRHCMTSEDTNWAKTGKLTSHTSPHKKTLLFPNFCCYSGLRHSLPSGKQQAGRPRSSVNTLFVRLAGHRPSRQTAVQPSFLRSSSSSLKS